MTDQSIYKFMYSNFVRYEVLTDLFNSTYINSGVSLMQLYRSKKHVNIYIDIISLYPQQLFIDPDPSRARIISVNILNMAAHYRHYFRKTFGCSVDVYIINGRRWINLDHYLDFTFLQKAFNIINIICKYLPTVYYIEENEDACVIAASTASMEHLSSDAFIVSRNVLSYQLPFMGLNKEVLRPGRQPKIITFNNALQLWSKSKTNISDLKSGLLPLVMAMNKCPELGLPTLANLSTVVKGIRAAIANKIFLNGYNTPSDIYVTKGIITQKVFSRWMLCDLTTMTSAYELSPSNLYAEATWKIKKHCDFGIISKMIDDKINSDPENILNYVYLVD